MVLLASFSDAPVFELRRHSRREIHHRIEALKKSNPELGEILRMEAHEVVEKTQEEKEKEKQEKSQKKAGGPPEKAKDLVGFPPGFTPCWRETGTCSKKPKPGVVKKSLAFDNVQSPLGLSNTYHYLYLIEYLKVNGGMQPCTIPGDGECQFSSVRRQVQHWAQWGNAMLRRQLALFMLEQHQLLFPLLKDELQVLYGMGTGKDTDPGPFSYLDYCMYISELGNWGDNLSIKAMSYMMGVKVTIIILPDITEVRIRHNDPLPAVQLILLLHEQHYSAVGEYTHIQHVVKVSSASI